MVFVILFSHNTTPSKRRDPIKGNNLLTPTWLRFVADSSQMTWIRLLTSPQNSSA